MSVSTYCTLLLSSSRVQLDHTCLLLDDNRRSYYIAHDIFLKFVYLHIQVAALREQAEENNRKVQSRLEESQLSQQRKLEKLLAQRELARKAARDKLVVVAAY